MSEHLSQPYPLNTPASELKSRLEQLQQSLQEKELDGVLLVGRINFYYFSGTAQQGWLYIPQAGEPVLMVFKEYARARRESALENVVSLASSKKIPAVIAEAGLPEPKTVGMELDILPVTLFRQYQKVFAKADIKDISLAIRLQRAVKSSYEIDLVRRAVAHSDIMAEWAKTIFQEGKSELEAAGEYEGHARALGHQGVVWMRLFNSDFSLGHLLCGPEAAEPSYFASPNGGIGPNPLVAHGSGRNLLKRNQPILLDYTFASEGYISDHSRVYSIGPLADDLLRGHEAMCAIQEKAKALAVPGAVAGEIYQQLVEMAEKFGYADNFMGAGERPIRFIGHGVGLELDEFPFIAMNQDLVLKNNMVLALEPKLILPGKGMVGIENTHIITEHGLEQLGIFPDEVCVLDE